MGNDIIAWVIAIGLGIVVVVLGLRRNLSETTRSGLPRFEEAAEQENHLGSFDGSKGRRSLSPMQARWLALVYLLAGLGNLIVAASSSDDRLAPAAIGALFTLASVALFLGKWPGLPKAPAS